MVKILPWMHNKKIIEETAPAFRFDGTRKFSEWQSEAHAKLSSLLGLENIKKPADDKFTVEYTKECDDFTEIRFTIESEEGYSFPSVMLIPKNLKAPAPVMLCLQGHSTGMHISLARPIYAPDEEDILSGDRDYAIRAVKEGFIAVAIEQRNVGECGSQKNGNPDCHVSTMTALLLGRTTIGERVHDVSCVIDALLEHFDIIDKNKIMLMGNSGGGTATIYAAAIDRRISLAMPSCSVCAFKNSIAAMNHCVCNFVPNIAKYFDMGELCQLVAPRSLIVVNGIADDIFPIDGAKACLEVAKIAFAAAGVSDRLHHVIGKEGHRFYADDTWPILHGEIKKL